MATLAIGLRKKNLLVQELNDLKKLILRNNRVQVIDMDSTPKYDYDCNELLLQYDRCLEELVALKSLLDEASLPIRDQIYRLSELKSKITMYKSIPTKSGIDSDYGASIKIYKVQMDAVTADGTISKIQNEIELLQNSISAFNNATTIPDL